MARRRSPRPATPPPACGLLSSAVRPSNPSARQAVVVLWRRLQIQKPLAGFSYKLALFPGHRTRLLCATSRGNFISSAFPQELRYGDLIREMSSQACPRSAAPHCSLPREGGSPGSALRAFAPAPKVFCILSTPPMRGRPATNWPYPAAPVRRRRPYKSSRTHNFRVPSRYRA